jgi:hypothetical protein
MSTNSNPPILYEYQFHHATNKSEVNWLERTRNTRLIHSSQVTKGWGGGGDSEGKGKEKQQSGI